MVYRRPHLRGSAPAGVYRQFSSVKYWSALGVYYVFLRCTTVFQGEVSTTNKVELIWGFPERKLSGSSKILCVSARTYSRALPLMGYIKH
ncbi:hypothetical protein JTB14_018218 [Gonioctena quinquepunctata]|nr:hypothetical protein JTB14_018218 [Gonioctena quinquepunctata]